jgi:regulator of protease activity HflC (stomatin/prohibitin superfamily)
MNIYSLLLVFLGVKIIPDGYGRIVERLGRRHRVLMPGVNINISFLDRIKTRGFKDNSEIWVDTVAYFRLIDPMKIAYDVAAFESNFVSIIETNLRQ